MYCVDEAQEVREAEESARVLDLAGRCLVTMDADTAESVAERAFERACIVAADRPDRGAVGGLVSVPTTFTRQSVARVRDEARELREALEAQETDRRAGRVARLRRAVGFSARAIGAALDRPGFRQHYAAMLTLTYRDADDWKPEHLTALLRRMSGWLKRRGARLYYVWVGELQKRGALHYHVCIWLPPGLKLPMPDKPLPGQEVAWWPHGSTNIVAARRAVPYLLKYMSKGMETSGFPKGARIYGTGGQDHALKRARRWLGLPAFVRARADIHDDWKRATGGGWWSPEGICLPSEYERAWVGDRWACVQVCDYGRPFDAAGPFSWVRSA